MLIVKMNIGKLQAVHKVLPIMDIFVLVIKETSEDLSVDKLSNFIALQALRDGRFNNSD
jgi:hypothetical protein